MASTQVGIKENPGGESKWLHVHYDPLANIRALSSGLALADLHGDEDVKLVVADLGLGLNCAKVKVFSGTSLLFESTLTDLPSGVGAFHTDPNQPKGLAIAVASGSCIYVYKNLRPYFKFTLPPLKINAVEQDLWAQVREDKIDLAMLKEMLKNLRTTEGDSLSLRSLRFLTLTPPEMEPFIDLHKDVILKRETVITCMSTLKKSLAEEHAVSCPVIGTENCEIYVLDPEAFTILTKMNLPNVPVLTDASGLFDVDFRIIVSCRNGMICMLKRNSTEAKIIIKLTSHAVGLVRVNKNIVLGCMDETLSCYTHKGKKQWVLQLSAAVVAINLLDHKARGFQAVLVALANSEVQVYQDNVLVDSIQTQDVVTGICFGRYGREENTLIMTTKGGGLVIKILKRTAVFEKDKAHVPSARQVSRLQVPKKTKLYVDQMLREQENATAMHRVFQSDLFRLRLTTARAYASALEQSLAPVSNSVSQKLQLNAMVQGMGPTFKLTVHLKNTSSNCPLFDLFVVFCYDERLYSFPKAFFKAPMLIPGVNYPFEVLLESCDSGGASDVIKT
uniref:Bardet-Biedl syndrome 1 n=1 Tax=Eptatretus burgeri TaxID=7764 RepID=A0A8C4QU40_EPTBU